MELDCRRDQFSYFLGFVSKGSERFLNEAMRMHVNGGYSTPSPNDVFRYCPYNDNLAQIIRAVQIFENGKKPSLAGNLNGILTEFLFLASDFEPPCCGDGRSFYEKTSGVEVVLGCDRCGAAYSLNGSPVRTGSRMKMTRPEFVEIFGEDTEKDWPYHARLKMAQGETTP